MDNKDGSLYFAAGIDRSKWKADLDKMRAEILGIEKTANNTDINFGITKENIAIQKQVIADIKAQMKEIEKAANDMAPGLSQATVLGELKPLMAELDAEEKALVELQGELSKTQAKYNSLTTERNKALDTMRILTLEGRTESAEYKKAEKNMLDYTRAIDQTNAQAKAMAAGGLANVVQGIGVIAGAMAAGQSIMGLFAGENENLNRIMLKTQALLSVSVTLQQLHTAVTKEGVFGITSLTTVKNVWAAANARVAVSLGITTAAAQVLIGTLTLGLTVAIGALIVAWDRLSERQAKVAELNKKVADSVAEPLIAYRQLQDQWKTLGGDLKSQEKFINGNQDAFRDLGIEVKTVNDVENALIRQTSAVTKSLMLRAQAAAKAEVAQEAYKKALQARMDYESESKIMKDGTFGERGVVAVKMNLRSESLIETQNKNNAIFNKMMNESTADARAAAEALRKAKITPWIGDPNKVPAAKKPKTKKEIAEEILPAGSVAEIQKRMATIDEALSKSTNEGQIEALKAKRIAAAAELAEAIKKIEIKSLEERANEQAKYNTAYAVIAELQGKEAADKMYGPLMEGAQSYYGWLTNEQDKLLQKGGLLSDEDKENLAFLTTKINEIEGKKNAFQNFTEGIDDALDKIPTLAGQIEFLQNKAEERLTTKGNKSFDDGEQKYLKEQQEKLLEQQKANYEAFLKEKETFEQKKAAIDAKYDQIDASINGSDNTADEKARLLAESGKSRGKEYSQAFLDGLKNTEMWQKAFGDIAEMTNREIKENIVSLKIQVQQATANGGTAEEIKVLQDRIKELQGILNNNPFEKIAGSFKILRDEASTTDQKLKAAQDMFNGLGEGVNMIGDAFGGFGDAADDAIGNIMAIGNAAFDLAKSIASGDVAGMISAGIKLIGSIGKAINGDQKKERNIKKQAAVLKQLELAYTALAFAAERAFGSMKYSGQRDLIRNLEQQRATIQSMMASESSKKKADKDKIYGYQQQIQGINQSIQSIKEGIVKDVLQTDVVDAAAKVGDALVDAFGRGEDAAKSLEQAANDMIKNLLKNQLNLMLQNRMRPILDNLLSQAGFNQDGTGNFTGLTPEQIAAFKAQVLAAGQSMQGFLEAYGDIFGGLEANQEGLKGDIKGITEKTAGALEAQINAIRIYQVEANNIHKANQQTFVASLQQLVQIEYNTRNLIQIRQDISEMNSKMKKQLAGVP